MAFRPLFDQNPLPMLVFDRDTLEILEINQAAEKLYGYSHDDLLAMRVTDLRPEEDVPEVLAKLHAPLPQVGVVQSRHRLRDGKIVEVEVTAHEVLFRGRRAKLAVIQEISQRRQLEAQLRQSQRMEAVGMLAGGIAHDFNNLLTIITGYSQLLINGIPAEDPNHMAAEQIMKAGERAAALTRQLLTFSRRQALQPKVLDLNILVTSLSQMLRRVIGEHIDLQLSLAPDLGRVSADAGQIEQVIMNLVVNSRDAMPQGGTVRIETANVDLASQQAGTQMVAKPGSYVMLSVVDTGTGMDAETRTRAFEPFFTTKGQGKGTGLGLSTVFGIVKQSGGNLAVSSEPGKGTSFRVYLPRIDQTALPENEAELGRVAGGSETILLVEDEEMVRHLVRETLEREGYKVLDAADAMKARRICENYQGRIHLMISDVVMPKVGGRELAESVRPVRPDMKVLFMSGYTDRTLTGMQEKDQFIQKPFTPAALARKVREVLESQNGERTRHA